MSRANLSSRPEDIYINWRAGIITASNQGSKTATTYPGYIPPCLDVTSARLSCDGQLQKQERRGKFPVLPLGTCTIVLHKKSVLSIKVLRWDQGLCPPIRKRCSLAARC